MPEWFSSVYFNGTLYTYAYGVTELLCGNCDSDYWAAGEASMLGGELVGASLGDRWGAIHERYGLAARVLFPSHRRLRASPFLVPRLPGSICNPNVPLPTRLDS